jgi:DNA adenine methylase
MKTSSPLRYPGGKSAMTELLADIRRINRLGDLAIAEPFAGGAGASLSLLYLEETHRIYINDADPAIYDFWWTLVNRPQPFMDMLEKTPVNIDEWRRQRSVYADTGQVSRLRRGFAAFYLNRCNRSGIIINGGPIGGITQEGKWKLDARFNKSELRSRCERVAEYRERIDISCDDGLNFIKNLDPKTIFFFIDPPYFEKGSTLYLNGLDGDYHKELAILLKAMSDSAWVLTYDDCAEIRRMYCDWAEIHPYSLRYTAAVRRPGNELLITPKWMQLPRWQASALLTW